MLIAVIAVLIFCASSPASNAPAPSDLHAGVTNAAPGGAAEALAFYLTAGGAVLSAIGICVGKNIVRMAVWLFVALGSVAMMYFLLAANFLGAIQLIVYAGGTLVLLIFGVMLTSKSPWVRYTPKAWEALLAGTVCVLLLVTLGIVLSGAVWPAAGAMVPGQPVSVMGRKLMTEYLVPFEVAGVLLMIVMVGAAHLARQET
jgi:NADH:ubiquinone oxidoreductase subunit 6 (subunit J)